MLKLIMLILGRFIKFTLLFIFVILIASCLKYQKQIPEARDGVIDLSKFDFEKMGFTSLSGEYEFYWQEIIFPQEFETKEKLSPEFIYLPSVWNNKPYKGKTLKGPGYATFRLKLILNSSTNSLAMYIKNFATSYRLYLNGILIATNGIVS